jgi:hypothetical protein
MRELRLKRAGWFTIRSSKWLGVGLSRRKRHRLWKAGGVSCDTDEACYSRFGLLCLEGIRIPLPNLFFLGRNGVVFGSDVSVSICCLLIWIDVNFFTKGQLFRAIPVATESALPLSNKLKVYQRSRFGVGFLFLFLWFWGWNPGSHSY